MTGMILRKGRVFRFGDYPKQRFRLDREGFEAANAGVESVPIGFDPVTRRHYIGKSNAFDGMLGSASNLSVSDGEITADFAIAPLLHDAIEKEGLRMSAVFDRETKRLKQIDFVDAPIIEDAALFAEDEEEVAIFADPAMLPPGSEADEDDAALSKEELAQHFHEALASVHPELCDPDHTPTTASFAADHHKFMAQVHDMAVHHGAHCSGMGHARFAEDEEEEDDMANENENEGADNTALFAQMQDELAQLRASSAKDRAKRIAVEAVGFAKDNAERLTPVAKAAFAGLYQALAMDDETHEAEVGFAHGAETFKGSRVDLLKRAVEALEPHGFGKAKTLNAKVAAPEAKNGLAVFSDVSEDDPKIPTPERAAELKRLAGLPA